MILTKEITIYAYPYIVTYWDIFEYIYMYIMDVYLAYEILKVMLFLLKMKKV